MLRIRPSAPLQIKIGKERKGRASRQLSHQLPEHELGTAQSLLGRGRAWEMKIKI